VVLSALGTALHFFVRVATGRAPIFWLFLPTAGIGLAALVALRWLPRSLSRAVLFSAWATLVCVGMIFVYELEAKPGSKFTEYAFVVNMFHVGIFTLGLILGFRPALHYAVATALFFLFVGVVYVRLPDVFTPIALAFAAALPAKVVEHLIDESTAELERFNAGLQREIIERQYAEEALQQHRERLEDLVRERTAQLEAHNEELDAFAHTVAHDLKSPLAVILGYAETLKNYHTDLPGEELVKHLHVLSRNCQKMKSIIEELMVLSGVRKMEVRPEPLDMGSIVTEVQSRLSYLIEEYQAEISGPGDGEWPVALGYAPWIEEVWVNYIINAIQYGGRPPRVELGFLIGSLRSLQVWDSGSPILENESKIRDPKSEICFWVRDNGRGLCAEEQVRLFAPFTQLDRIRTQGHGLGLSIVHRILKKLGGRAWVESDGVPGQGSTFYFALPAPVSEPATPGVSLPGNPP
jgi:signal transduction histidine kinase